MTENEVTLANENRVKHLLHYQRQIMDFQDEQAEYSLANKNRLRVITEEDTIVSQEREERRAKRLIKITKKIKNDKK